jgi:hypothetical protein
MGISRDLAVQDLTPVVPDEEKAVQNPRQNPKGELWHGEKVLRGDGLARIPEDVSARTFGRTGVWSALFPVPRARRFSSQRKPSFRPTPFNCVTPASQCDPAFCNRLKIRTCGSRTCKPNSVRLAAGRSFLWAAHYCAAQATYPEVVAHRAGTLPREARRLTRKSLPIWSCSVWGLPCPPHYCGGGALLPHLFTLT